MPKNSYSEKQIEAMNLLKSSDSEISPSVIDEIVQIIGSVRQGENKEVKEKEESEIIIKMRLFDETNWRKKAALSALLISNNLKD